MISEYLNSYLLFVLILINCVLHFVINAKKRKQKEERFVFNLKSIVMEGISFLIVILISLAESMLIDWIYRLIRS